MPKKTCIFPLALMMVSLLAGPVLERDCRAMPRAEKIELPNGLKLLVFEEHSIPAVTMVLLVDAGSWRDPPDMKGLANLTAKSVLLGTRFLSFNEVNDKLDFMGASLDADTTKDFALLGMQVLKKELEPGVELFSEIVVHPSFPAADVAGQKDDIIGALRQKEDEPLEVAARAFDRALFVDNPYADPVEGAEKSVAAIGLDELSRFYDSFYRPNNSILVIGGDITPQEVGTLIVPRLSGWQAAEVPQTAFRNQFAEGEVNVLIDKPVAQATIILGCPGVQRASPDYYPLQVMNQIVGSGDLASRLMVEIRVKKGLAYDVESYPESRMHAGSFRVVIQTKDVSAKESIELARHELERLRQEPVSEAELNLAKKFLIGNFPLKYNAQMDYAKFLAQIEFFGLGPDYPDRYPALTNAVTHEDIQRVAGTYIKPDNVTVIVADLKKAGLK